MSMKEEMVHTVLFTASWFIGGVICGVIAGVVLMYVWVNRINPFR